MDRIAIIVVHYNTDEDTNQCLASLTKISKKGWQQKVYVVDNGSKELYLAPKLRGLKDLEVLRSESNLGFTGGTNLGIEHALSEFEADFVLLLNSDTLVEKNFLKHLYQAAKDQPDSGLLNPLVFFAREYEYHQHSYQSLDLGKVIWFAGGSIDWEHLVGFHRGVDELDRDQFASGYNPLESQFATGCCLLIKREVIETIGYMDESFFLYWEDVDYSLRARKAGFKISLVPDSIIWHKNAGSSDGVGSRVQQYYQTRNRFALAIRYGGLKIRLQALRLAGRTLAEGSLAARAVFDAFTGRMGKRTIV